MRTSFHHQPEAQHPKSPAIETPAGRLPHLLLQEETNAVAIYLSVKSPKGRHRKSYPRQYSARLTMSSRSGRAARPDYILSASQSAAKSIPI